MDNFVKAQHEKIGIGGINCYCCNNKARKGHGKVDRKLNGVARAKMKVEAMRMIIEELN